MDPTYAVYETTLTANVGAHSVKGDGRWGQADMAGNIWEWVQDSNATYVTPCINCANLTTGLDGVIRGGSYAEDGSYLFSWNRISDPRANSALTSACVASERRRQSGALTLPAQECGTAELTTRRSATGRDLRNVPIASRTEIRMPNTPGPAKKYFHASTVLATWLATNAQAMT